MTHTVTKPLPTSDGVLEVGTEVDASSWKHTRRLEEQRYIRPIQPDGRDQRMGRKDQNAKQRN